MNTVPNIEPVESGPAWSDHASEEFEGYDAAAEEVALRAYFARQVQAGDANAVCPWAPWVHDKEAMSALGLKWTDKNLPKRAQTLAEVMVQSLDYSDGPSMTEAMHLILAATKSTDTDLAVLAGELVERMGASFAINNC